MRTPLSPRCCAALGLAALLFAPARLPGQEAAAVPPLVIEDFEVTTLGARPYLWKPVTAARGVEATVGVERAVREDDPANKALKIEYDFASPEAGLAVEAGPKGQPLPGSLTGITVWIDGDAGKNAVGLRIRDRQGETFEWQVAVTWSGWRKALYPLDPRSAQRGGTRMNGALDLPVTFDVIRLVRTAAGAARGEVLLDDLTAVCRFGSVTVLYDAEKAVEPEAWRAIRNRSRIGLAAGSLVPRGGREVPALKLEYEYEPGVDASVEFERVLPAGEGHGTLVAEVFGDGSNNILRFRMEDADGRLWQATLPTVLIDWAGWKAVYVDTRTLQDPTGGDPTGMPSKFPLRFRSLVIDDASPKDMLPGVESGRKGEVYLGRLLFCSER